MKLTALNRIQIPTWRWLAMNETTLDIDADLTLPYRGGVLTGAEEVKISRTTTQAAIPHLRPDLERLRTFVAEHHNYRLCLTIARGVQVAEPIVLDFLLDAASAVLVDELEIRSEAGSRATVVVRYRSDGEAKGFHAGFASVWAEAGSEVRLITIQHLGEHDTHLYGSVVTVGEGGDGSLLSCDTGGGQVISGATISLAERRSRGGLEAMYLGREGSTQDFNYRLEARGRESEGHIVCRGALAGNAKKTMKSTLDFIRGAVGAKGREEETVLSLSDRAIHRSIPLLLSGEDNVEGSHATSSGRIDPLKLTYLMSRGLSRREAIRLMVEASFTPLVNRLPTARLRDEVLEQIREVIDDGQR